MTSRTSSQGGQYGGGSHHQGGYGQGYGEIAAQAAAETQTRTAAAIVPGGHWLSGRAHRATVGSAAAPLAHPSPSANLAVDLRRSRRSASNQTAVVQGNGSRPLPLPPLPPALSWSDIKKLKMPDSPEHKGLGSSPPSSPSGQAPTAATPPARSHSNSSCHSAGTFNGSSHSPVSGGSNGRRTPSPSSLSNNPIQQLPPACGAKQLSKLKRFLTTLQQFGSDISVEIGDRVRSLVLALVNSHITIEEFHAKLQETTNFPLKPFVIPFLKATLPLLQRELMQCARLARQSPQHYLAHNEHVLFDTSTHSPVECHDASAGASANEVKANGSAKRKTPDSSSTAADYECHVQSKRLHGLSPGAGAGARLSPPLGTLATANATGGSGIGGTVASSSGGGGGGIGRSDGLLSVGGGLRLEDISLAREFRERQKLERERIERSERLFAYPFLRGGDLLDPVDRIDDDWKHVETMLSCIVGMVDKTKRALAALQERYLRDREELALYSQYRHADTPGGPQPPPQQQQQAAAAAAATAAAAAAAALDREVVKKRTDELMAQTLRATEDRVSDVKRRAEEAVNEVKRQAVIELQKAVCMAESNANEMIATERLKMERTLKEVRKQAQEEILAMINVQEDSSENCWNCGRKASETCSGCNVARYCGAFCQHKDWENHHVACGKAETLDSKASSSAAGTSSSSTKGGSSRHRKPSSPRPGLLPQQQPPPPPTQAAGPADASKSADKGAK